MASPATVQTLLAAFFFGILLQAALGVLLIQVKENGVSVREDGRRLALVLFLIFAALWALIDFINLNITSSTTSCQAALVFSTLTDQLARVCIEQFLLWSIGHGSIPTLCQLILQFALGVRLVIGAVFVGFTRPHFAPVCVARTSVLPIAIVVLAFDVVIITGLTIRSVSISAPGRGQKKALILIIVAFALWTGMSAAMLLGISSVILIIKTTLPSIGLLILVAFVTIFSASILSPSEGAVIPEATSPFITQSRSTEREILESFGSGSRISDDRFQTVGTPLFFNPPTRSQALHSTTTTIQGPYLESKKGPTISRLDRRKLPSEENQKHYRMGGSESGNQAPSGSANLAFAGSVVPNRQGLAIPQGGLVGGMERDLPVLAQAAQIPRQKRSLFKWSKQAPPSSIRAIGISEPVIVHNDDSALPFARIKTIDLATAANNERERREDVANRARLVPKRPAPPPPSASIEAGLHKSISVKRKKVLGRRSEAITKLPHNGVSGLPVGTASASTTSASISPGRENVHQRSPRGTNGFEGMVGKKASNYGLQRKPTIGLPSNPRAQKAAMAEEMNTDKQQGEGYSPESKLNSREVLLETSYSTELKSSGSILHRPRPYRRDTEKDRALFPTGVSPHHRRSKSGSPIAASRKSIFESHPGSPTQLPYMPAPPLRQSDLAHILSNGDQSMSYHEKIQFLFPTPPLSTLSNNRRSSVPSIPRLPSVYMSDSSPIQSSTDDGQQSSRASKKSRVISSETEDIWVAIATDADGQSWQREQSIKSSNTYGADAFTSSEAMPSSRNNFATTEGQLRTTRSTDSLEATGRNIDRMPRETDVSDSYTCDDGRQSFFLDENQSWPGHMSSSPRNEATWHRRIGDELPTFSERRKNSRTRKMPPPTPLILNWSGNNISVVVHSPAPSPIDSPGKALKCLQAQLKHFEDPNHVSSNSSSQQIIPGDPTAADKDKDGGNSRSKLLQVLEDEMGLQESLWQKMQHNFDRDSNSIVLTPQPPTPTGDDSPKMASQQSLSQHGRAHIMKDLTRVRGSSSALSHGSSNTRASGWQQRLNEAEVEYLDGAQALNRNRNINLFSIAQAQIGSPTPPESVDSETEIETSSESGLESSDIEWQHFGIEYRKDWLWKPQPPPSETAVSGLWDPAVIIASRTTSMDAPAKDVRPLRRPVQDGLRICSSVLWSNPVSASTGTYIGLWGSRKVRPKSINIRRISQRSQRKVKRVGYLPDIVESPQPLPHKRDTLGIFQFPSGETSDSAVYHSAFSPTLHYGTLKLNSVPQTKAENQGPDPMGYPSSFFDDYDEQDDSDDLDSDDDFDESTLWEISNLLYSRDVSSMEDFHPLATEPRNANPLVTYEDGIRFEMEPEEQDIIIGMSTETPAVIHDPIFELPIRPLALNSNIHSKLWTHIPEAKANDDVNGLPQPNSKTWESYVSNSHNSIRSKSRQSQTLRVLSSSSLWTPSHVEESIRSDAGLWTTGPDPQKVIRPENRAVETTPSFLWSHAVQKSADGPLVADASMLWAPSKVVTSSSDIPSGKARENTVTSTSLSFASIRKARTYHASLAKLMSHQLWSEHKVLDAEHHWISESSVRPESPSVRSDSSSGGSSPTSDTLSVKSTSTKASSIWSSLKSVQVSLSWNHKPAKSSVLSTPAETKESSGSPISPPEPRFLPSKRDSRILTVRNIFEPRTSESGETLVEKESISHGTGLVSSAACSPDKDNGCEQTLLQTQQLPPQPNFTFGPDPNKNLMQAIASSTTPVAPYDVAARHPVFFTSNFLSSIADIHPAAIGYTTNPSVTKDTLANIASPSFEAPLTVVNEARMRSSIWAKAESAANFEYLWSKDLVIRSSNRSEDVKQKTATTLEMWSPSAKFENLKNTALMAATRYSSQDMAPPVGRERSGKFTASRQLPLPIINTNRLFEPQISPSEPPIYWLHSTSHMPEASARSLTWEAPTSTAILEYENTGMWAPRTAVVTPSPALFSNPHEAPWARKKRCSVSAKDITSSELWRLPAELPRKPKHWLIDRRASRVQFRY